MEFNEFREKVKEALPDFLTDDLRNAEIKDTAVNKLQGESYSGISVTPEGSRVGVSINLEDAFLDYQTGSQFTAVMNRLADTLVGTLGERKYNGSLSFRLTAPYSEERRETAVCQREQRYYSV